MAGKVQGRVPAPALRRNDTGKGPVDRLRHQQAEDRRGQGSALAQAGERCAQTGIESRPRC